MVLYATNRAKGILDKQTIINVGPQCQHHSHAIVSQALEPSNEKGDKRVNTGRQSTPATPIREIPIKETNRKDVSQIN